MMIRSAVFLALLFTPATLMAQQTATVPKHTIISDKPVNNGAIRDVVVRIDAPISEEDVGAIANKIKTSSVRQYPTTSIFFLLPEQTLNQGAWARALFKPTLKVTILGASAEATKKATAGERVVDGEKIGEWKWDFVGQIRIIVIAKRGDDFFQTTFFDDGSKREEELGNIGLNQFSNKRGTKVAINEAGNLDIYGEDGRIFERAVRIK